MTTKAKFKILPLLIIVFIVLAAARVIFWDFGTSNGNFVPPKAVKPILKKVKKPVNNPNFRVGSFTLDVNLPLNEKTIVQYIVPVDPGTGKARKSASNIVFYAPYTGDAGRISKGLHPWLHYFPEKLGYTVFSLTIKANTLITNDKSKFYIYKEVGWFDIIFKIQERLIKEFKLEYKPFFIVGESSGGSLAQRMAACYPDKIAAAAWNGGAVYDLSAPGKVPFLALNTWGCPGVTNTKKLTRHKGVQVLHGEGPPVWNVGKLYHHGASKTTYDLIQTFIHDIVKLRDKNNGIVPLPVNWPVNMEICGRKQYFPSEKFASLWQKLPHELSNQLFNNSKEIMIYLLPEKPDKIVFLPDNPVHGSGIMIEDSLYFLNMNNAVAVSLRVGDAPIQDAKSTEKALKKILENPEWKNLDVYLVGSGIAGQIAAVTGLINGNKRIKKITVLNVKYDYPFSELSIAAKRKLSNIPLVIYNKRIDSLPAKINNTTVLPKPNSGNSEQDWFEFLANAIK